MYHRQHIYHHCYMTASVAHEPSETHADIGDTLNIGVTCYHRRHMNHRRNMLTSVTHGTSVRHATIGDTCYRRLHMLPSVSHHIIVSFLLAFTFRKLSRINRKGNILSAHVVNQRRPFLGQTHSVGFIVSSHGCFQCRDCERNVTHCFVLESKKKLQKMKLS